MELQELELLLERASEGEEIWSSMLEKTRGKAAEREEVWSSILEGIREKVAFKRFLDPAIDGDVLLQELVTKILCRIQKQGKHWTDREGREVESKGRVLWRTYTFTFLELLRASKKEWRQNSECQDESEISPSLEEIPDPNSDFSVSIERDNLVYLIWGYNPPKAEWKQAARLYHQEDLSIAETARLMDATPSAVKTWLRRWRMGVQEFLRKRGVI